MSNFPLSVLDLSPVGSGFSAATAIQNSLSLARRADELGFYRYWFAEHHNMGAIASSSPEILIGQAGTVTKRIRLGSGGVMLPNHPPLRVAENFRTLEALFPGRIDLGLGRAPGTNSRATLALRRNPEAMRADDFPELLEELFYFLTGEFPERHPFATVRAVPVGTGMPEVWLLGSSDFSARMAAELGLRFGFAHHFSELPATRVVQLYREHFKPSRYLDKPYALVATNVITAETDAKAEEIATASDFGMLRFRQTGKLEVIPSVADARGVIYTDDEKADILRNRLRYFIGSSAAVKERLETFVKDTGADEIMASTMIHNHKDRLRSYELLAQSFGLK